MNAINWIEEKKMENSQKVTTTTTTTKLIQTKYKRKFYEISADWSG